MLYIVLLLLILECINLFKLELLWLKFWLKLLENWVKLLKLLMLLNLRVIVCGVVLLFRLSVVILVVVFNVKDVGVVVKFVIFE